MAAAAGGGGGGFGGSGMVAVCFGGDVFGRNERRVESSFGGGIWAVGFGGFFHLSCLVSLGCCVDAKEGWIDVLRYSETMPAGRFDVPISFVSRLRPEWS